jgi:PAS domain S-box-containing protein
MVLVGGSSWVAFWMLMHLGIWRKRRDPVAFLPAAALVLAVVEGAVLLVGGSLAAGRWLVVGLAFPTLLLAVSHARGVASLELPGIYSSGEPSDRDADPQAAREIALLALLILAAVAWGWWIARFAVPGSGVAANRVLVVSLLISTFVGVAWASWTSLRKLDLLARARARAAALLASAADAVVVTDGEGRIVSANPAASQLFGVPAGDLRGRPLSTFLPELDGPPAGWERWAEYPVQGSDGTRIAEVAGREARGWGEPEYTITLRDVTERRETEDALRASEERLDLALDVTRAAVWDYDVPTGGVYQSSQWARMIGEEGRRGNRGQIEDWRGRLHPDDRDSALRSLETHLRGETEFFESEHRIRTASGRWLWVLERGRVVERDPEGRPFRMVGTTADLSERKALELRFLQSQKMEAVGQLAGGVAHDFNNVLTAILGTSEFLLDGETPLTPEQERDVRDILDAALRAREITHHLLAFSRRQQLMPRVVAPDEVLRRSERLLARLLNESIRIEVDIDPAVGRIRTDPAQLEQAIVNLVVNARDAMPQGGTLTLAVRSIRITREQVEAVEGVRPGPGVELSVTDTGLGMDPATRARAFEPFFTTKALGAGTGLGLAMVYGFVRQSGGIVEVESVPGEGTTVRLIFPQEEERPRA